MVVSKLNKGRKIYTAGHYYPWFAWYPVKVRVNYPYDGHEADWRWAWFETVEYSFRTDWQTGKQFDFDYRIIIDEDYWFKLRTNQMEDKSGETYRKASGV